MEVDIIEFKAPTESNKALFIWDLQAGYSHAYIYERVFSAFSSFGPLFLVKVLPNSPSVSPGFYSLVKFYCSRHALQAQRSTDGTLLFQSTPVKVRLSTRQAPFLQFDNQLLSHSRCLELANHCLGFNGWSTRIINLKVLPSDSLEEGQGHDASGRSQEVSGRSQEVSGRSQTTLRYGCLLELSFPQHGVSTRGVAVIEETFSLSGPAVCMQKHSKLQRWVRDKALVHAFSSVLLILLGDGRVMVELRPGDQLRLEDQPDEVIKVNELVTEPEEEEPADLAFS
ncbi:RAD52 motif-containing protein 1 [Gadus morhua]|uniref:RAD52 motif-containing protein 1 n=1 Tax=Gadus morhua TaxID=8049 RepID=UPI0011B35882|nr:RAD52 motif-containing protein 1-like [Gadus morhua]XP_030197401.1 RAD52 motif-containing protein 1-like [Gadus morhua]XP_030197410.1 RAD52 motif-containing protein 1-like [Gadus morhua]